MRKEGFETSQNCAQCFDSKASRRKTLYNLCCACIPTDSLRNRHAPGRMPSHLGWGPATHNPCACMADGVVYVWANGYVHVWADGVVYVWADAADYMWANGVVYVWANWVVNVWANWFANIGK
jgi:hypothetical protein